jgi:hypothetical protein
MREQISTSSLAVERSFGSFAPKDPAATVRLLFSIPYPTHFHTSQVDRPKNTAVPCFFVSFLFFFALLFTLLAHFPQTARSMKISSAAVVAWALSAVLVASQVIGPSTTVPPFMLSRLAGVTTTSLITVDDLPATNGYQLIGIPDGLGVMDGPEMGESEDVFYILANHELPSSEGAVRAHGAQGAFVSQWKVNKTSLEVMEGQDLIQTVGLWDFDLEDWVLSTDNAL